MPSDRVRRILAEAVALPTDERSELVDVLSATLEDEPLSQAWRDELTQRMDEYEAARARGERGGVEMAVDDLIARLRHDTVSD
jgi:putative addiction module component (TIGR02574 family)